MLIPFAFPLCLLFVASLVDATCQKYLTAAQAAAGTLQSTRFSNGTYGKQAVWISAVDTFYLLQRARELLSFSGQRLTH
jgi:hypothetical protein